MSASRIFLPAVAVLFLLAACAYDPQIAAQYSKDGEGEAIVGPQLPKPGRPSTFEQQLQRTHGNAPEGLATNSSSAPVAAKKTPSPSSKSVAASSAEENSLVNAPDLALPKPETSESPAPLTPPDQVEVQEKIVVDVNPPATASASTVVPAADPTTPATTAAQPVASTPEPPAGEVSATPAPEMAAVTPPATTSTEQPTASPDSKEEQVAVVETSFGRIVIELNPQAAPITVENFKKLASSGFYNGTTFHRVIPDFMIQGGDPNSKNAQDRASHGKGGPDYTLQAEIKLKHKRGSVAMARLPNKVNPLKSSNGSQFYICVIDCPFLDDDYTVFGQVISGMKVVDRISTQSRDETDNPNQRIEMKVSLVPKSQALGSL